MSGLVKEKVKIVMRIHWLIDCCIYPLLFSSVKHQYWHKAPMLQVGGSLILWLFWQVEKVNLSNEQVLSESWSCA